MKRIAIMLFIIGIVMILGAPYIPSALFEVIKVYDYHYFDIRIPEIIPSIRICGIIISMWGMIFLFKTKDINIK